MVSLQVPFRNEHLGSLQHFEIMRLCICCCALHEEEPLIKADCGTLSSLILETKILDANNVYANQLSFLLVLSLVLLQPGTLA